MREKWRAVPGYNFIASSYGRIRGPRDTVLKPHLNNKGYPMVCYYEEGKMKWALVSHLVLLAFVGPRPDGAVARHIKNNKRTDCRAVNLAWGTAKQNIEDKRNHGTFGWKLTEENVREIRRRRKNGEATKAIAKRFKVSEWHVRELTIPDGRCWREREAS